MGIYSTKTIKEISEEEFWLLIKKKKVLLSTHALWHLSQRQRKVFNVEELINIITRETPRKVYLQENQRYAVFYRKRDGYRKIIFEITKYEVVVVTFVDIKEIPKNDLKND